MVAGNVTLLAAKKVIRSVDLGVLYSAFYYCSAYTCYSTLPGMSPLRYVEELLLQRRGIVDCLGNVPGLKEESADFMVLYVVIGLILGGMVLVVSLCMVRKIRMACVGGGSSVFTESP